MGGSREAIRKAPAGLEWDCQDSSHEYWPVDADLRELSDSQRSQLLMLAHRHRGQLATFDTGIRELAPGTRYANSLLVL